MFGVVIREGKGKELFEQNSAMLPEPRPSSRTTNYYRKSSPLCPVPVPEAVHTSSSVALHAAYIQQYLKSSASADEAHGRV